MRPVCITKNIHITYYVESFTEDFFEYLYYKIRSAESLDSAKYV